MKTRGLTISIVLFLFFNFSILSQETWTLEKCINYAIENNIQVKQKLLQAKSGKNSLRQSKANLLPAVNASAQDAFQFGRTIDPYDNTFTEENIQSLSMSITASMTIFNGLQQYHTIRQNNFNLLSQLADVEDTKYNISLLVASAYLQILFDMELLEVAKNQLAITQSQVERTRKLVDAGSLAKGNLLEIQAQYANEELMKINAENSLKTSYLTLTQLMELPSAEGFAIEVPKLADPSEMIVIDPIGKIYEGSQGLPMIKRQEYSLKSSEQTLKIAKGALSPVVFVSTSYGTGYSNRRSKYSLVQGDPRQIGYVGTTLEPVLAPTFNTISSTYPFSDQLNDNRSFSFAIGVQIPIFNKLGTYTRISQSKLNVENSKHMLDLTKNQLYKDIQNARNAAESAFLKFKASQKSLEAQKESFSYTQQRFDLGLVNSVDYNTAKNRLTKTESDMVQAKFDFIFRINVLNFYQGIPIKL
jgi:outer membrane protein